MGQDAMILVFLNVEFKPAFSLSYFTFIKRLFSSSSLSAIRVVSSALYMIPFDCPLMVCSHHHADMRKVSFFGSFHSLTSQS